MKSVTCWPLGALAAYRIAIHPNRGFGAAVSASRRQSEWCSDALDVLALRSHLCPTDSASVLRSMPLFIDADNQRASVELLLGRCATSLMEPVGCSALLFCALLRRSLSWAGRSGLPATDQVMRFQDQNGAVAVAATPRQWSGWDDLASKLSSVWQCRRPP